jgi:uncharacterized membrane protein
MMKKILYFVLLFLWAMGILGGIGYSIYGGAWPIAVGVVVAGVLSWPKVKSLYNKLNE